MGTGDDPKQARATRKFDRDALAKLRRDAGMDPGERESSEPPPLTSRTTTTHDPLTMALLAEVARASRTIEVDPETIEEAMAEPAMPPEAAAPADAPAHPRIKRR